MVSAPNHKGSEPIAIVGSGCRFPGGSSSPSKLWELLKNPRDLAREIPEERFNVDRYYHPDNMHHGTSNVRESYLLEEDFKLFDANFFGVKHAEAMAMDPQQRLLLETVYESLESAGIGMQNLQGSQTGVFVGNMGVDYAELIGNDLDTFPTYFAPGTARSILSNRISYFFDWHGPSVTIDTACSSSLVAVHQAVQSLRVGETPVAVACGTNLLLGPAQYVAESKLKMLSPNGRSRMWDEAADGYARGEGFAAVVMKTLSAAIADGDHIECIIRETGFNQDGRTKGITMPSPIAQAELIRATYQRAGLDLRNPNDRPQYFEAHGTGTPAGDPVEAEAISTAFFGQDLGFNRQPEDPKLYVGSIKTVIGHTEGTAGLAALLKGSLAMKNGQIPPNLHLNRLNPAVQPFYANLQIPTNPQEWPPVPPGAPRRVSINSFGFGGANAHAIIESYEPDTPAPQPLSLPVFSPFTFSAASDRALAALLNTYAQYLRENEEVNLRDLAFTLAARRSTLQKRAVISAASHEALASKLEARGKEEKVGDETAARSLTCQPRILGVFTGQGAQWARMGAELVESSPAARAVLEELEQSLGALPVEDQPSWSLVDELLAPADRSRINEAELSQPLCTAVQVMLVTLLRSAGVRFAAVVGHSSGEIAAAFAAGYLSAADAIRIAYYRGFHLHRARGPAGQAGAMMAAGTSFEDAQELCALDTLEGRLCVAASNSSSSVTLSGDADAIQEAKDVFDVEKKFARLLKVDKAYHSHHMLPCAGPYVGSLQSCDIQIHDEAQCAWISSVYEDDIGSVPDSLRDAYWSSNMVRPVLFSQALATALGEKGPFDHVIEVGPHPALKGPASQTIQDVAGEKVPYTGTLQRGKHAVEALAECLGALWSSLGCAAVDTASYEAFASAGPRPRLLAGLPSYCWDHDRSYFWESRISRAIRTESTPSHELLGTRAVDNSATEVRWRNRLSPREVPWLKDHQVQGQIVFPGAGYISTALEAARQLFASEPISLIELKDVIIGSALTMDEGGNGVETLASLTAIRRAADGIFAHFAFFSQEGQESTKMVENASADLHIVLGEPSADALPPRPEPDILLQDMEDERFYLAVEALGFGYTGPFKAISGVQRKMDVATGLIANPEPTEHFGKLLFHPAALDGAIQSIILAYCFPGDSRLRSVHLPTRIDSVRFNFGLCADAKPATQLPFRSTVPPGESGDINGDVDVYSEDGQSTLLQLQGLHTTPLTPPSAATDLHLFSEFAWHAETPAGRQLAAEGAQLVEETAMWTALERVAFFYLNRLDREIPAAARQGLPEHHVRLFAYVDHVMSRVTQGTLPHISKDWIDDSHDQILDIVRAHPDSIDLQLMHAVGENLPAVVRNEMNMLEPMVRDNMLNRFYVDALGMARYTEELARMAAHISHRYPHMDVLEVGAGTGGATKVLLRELDNTFGSYTYTDISSGFFPQARHVFQDHEAKMTFKVLDIEKDVVDQGYEEQSFDLVIANLVVHATRRLEDTMKNLRRLVKPGGYLLLLEITDNDPLRFGFIFGGLPGWWLGHEDGRSLSPCVEVEKWDAVMRTTGFSGADAVTPGSALCPLSVILTQAVDERVDFLRQPLAASPFAVGTEQLTIVGGSPAGREVQQLLRPYYKDVSVISSLEGVLSAGLPVMGTVLSLADMDEPAFQSMDANRLAAFKHVFQQSKNVIWVTWGARADNPYSNMVVGVGRNIILEMKHLRLQFIDVNTAQDADAAKLAEKVLQFEIAETWEQQNKLEKLLWYTEPELALDKGQVIIPRIRLSKKRNLRYNSAKRRLTQDVDPVAASVALVPLQGSYILQELRGPVAAETRPDTVTVRVRQAVLRSVKLATDDHLYLVLGEEVTSGKPLFALADALASIVEVDRRWTVPCPMAAEQGEQTLVALYEQLMAQTIVSSAVSGSSLVLLDAGKSLAAALARRSAEKGVDLVRLTTDKSRSDCVFVHPQETSRSLQTKLPSKATAFVDLSGGSAAAISVAACLPARCQLHNLASLTDDAAHVTDTCFVGLDCAVPDLLRAAWAHARAERHFFGAVIVPHVSPVNLTQQASAPRGLCLVDWTTESKLPAQIQPAGSLVRFKQDKTYWLVGLTGGLGLSLCRWMIDRGARYIVITSRNPKVDPRWMESVEAMGATVRVVANDITNRDAVYSVYKTINATMPPIAGVAQGAMVLRDTMFVDMTVETMEKVLKPKVQGSIYLDEIFRDAPLDWFIFFSSIACITGNPGQSMYAAANMFMNSLAAQRRKRGVAGSTVEIGAIMGNGYVTRELTLQQQAFLHQVGNTWMSEQDFLTIFAEAVLASPPDSLETVETATGLRLQYGDEQITWFTNPMFQHLVLKTGTTVTEKQGAKDGVPVRTQLLEAKTAADVFEILKVAFLAKLQSTLQADAERDILNVPLEDLGMDSLVAVDVRSWFLKEVTVDVPVLKIMNGGTAKGLLEFAHEKLPASLTPKLGSSSGAEKPAVPSVMLPEEAAQEKPNVPQGVKVQLQNENLHVEQASSALSTTSPSPAPSVFTGDGRADASDDSETTLSDSIPSPEDCVERVVPMSFGQSRFWFLKFYVEDQTAFNITTLIRINGPLNIVKFTKAVQAVGQRHEALRTSFGVEDNRPVQRVWSSSSLKLEHEDISSEQDVDKAYESLKSHVYDLEHGETMQIKLLSKSSTEHFLVLGYHHINMDGISFEIFFSDLEKAYYGRPFTADVIQYPDFTLRELQEYRSEKWVSELNFWRGEFPDVPQPISLLPLSKKSSRPASINYGTHMVKRRVSSELSAKIRETCRKFKVTPFSFHLSIFKALLTRYVDSEDVCIGIADANRKDSDVMEAIGLYLNLLPLRISAKPTQIFGDAVREMQQKSQQVFANSRVPFDVLLNELNIPRSSIYAPLFQVFMNYRQGIDEVRSFCDCACEGELIAGGQIAYDISMDVVDNPGGDALVMLAVQKDLYDLKDAETLLDNYFNLLDGFSKNPAARLNRPAIHSTAAVEKALQLGAGPAYGLTWPATVVHRIDEMVGKYPGNVALKNGKGDEITYADMAARVNAIASEIQTRGTIGVFQTPTTDFICSILAIWRIGATYVPLETRVGTSRLAAIVQECQPSCILVDSETCHLFSELNCSAPSVDVSTILNHAQPVPNNAGVFSNAAAVLYTSGSTGTPKGITLSHASFRNNSEIATLQWGLQAETVLQQAAFSFDMSLSQTFLALCNGGTLVVAPKELRGDAVGLAQLIATEDVTVTQATPSEYLAWFQSGFSALQSSKWRVAMSGGERATEVLTDAFRSLQKPDLRLFNGYGPTEITFTSNARELQYEQPGCSASSLLTWPNYSVYIVDQDLKPLPVGVPGEVCIGGAGVGLGYLHNDALTAEKFVKDEYAPAHFLANGWTTMHRTGDRGRLCSDGGLILEGRIDGDTQIKLRGLRIDLQDIEAAIVKAADGKVAHAAVSVRQDAESSPQYLVAHVPQRSASPSAVYEALGHLPHLPIAT
ncbi:Beta-ketoacyl synthase [Macrophomina phaseolina MS6]|uniref:Beta-ketoacyl synthase n=1 Tax=Macrophomina phaseolina (strain MS6) TaxID=1126212 RepID=K2RMZ9_MACPH|nr:Beta-ketoacyl synthase [Macrophomina phaseolina MS6]